MTPAEEAAVLAAHEVSLPDGQTERRTNYTRRVHLVSMAEMAVMPMPLWRIYKLLSGFTLLWAGPGSFKTFLAISWAVAIASGRAWFGRKVKQGTVVFIVGEGALGAFYNRVRTAALILGIPAAEVDQLPLYATEGPVNLSKWDGLQAQEFRAAALELAERVGPVGLFAVDTVSRCVPGEENDQSVMQSFIATVDAIRFDLGADALAIHHSNAVGERERGSSVLGGAVDGNLQITAGAPDDEGNVPLSLWALKLKEAESGPGREAVVRLVARKAVVEGADGFPILDEAGEPLTTRYLVEAGPQDVTTAKVETMIEETVLDRIPAAGISASRLAKSLQQGKGSVLAALARLSRAGKVHQDGRGPSSKWHLSAIGPSVPEPVGPVSIGSDRSPVLRQGPRPIDGPEPIQEVR